MIKRSPDGTYEVSLRVWRWFPWPRVQWITCPDPFSEWTEVLGFIADWCCSRDIGKVLILDPEGPNPRMRINYRQWPGQVLGELEQ